MALDLRKTPVAAEHLQINRLELSEVFCAEDPQVDIVFVHGLNGHPRDTWTAKNGVFWPAQLLPRSLGSTKARVLVYGYNADVYAFGGKSATSDYIHQHAQTLVTTLDAERFNEDATRRPIIFVAHSLGGILVKRALEYSESITNVNTFNLRSIFVSTYGIIFLGTPHNGADVAKWGKMLQSMCGALLPRKLLDTEPQLVHALQTQSEVLQNINLAFVQMMDRFHICFFHEAVKTNLGLTQDFVVDQNSASPILPGSTYAGIEASHSDMCKFESKNAPGYTAVSANLKRFAQDAPIKVMANWAEELATREQSRQFQVYQLLGAQRIHTDPMIASYSHQPALSRPGVSAGVYSSPDVSRHSLLLSDSSHHPEANSKLIEPPPAPELAGPLLIVPAGFRPNAIFIGMKKELQELDDKLFDSHSRSRGSACVLLWCLSGGGKSHLARQYMYSNIDKFPGGIFWVRAKSKAEIAQDFWVIAQKAALKDVKDPDTATFEEDTETFIRTVKAWFEARQDWLIIFDGITIDKEDEKTGFQAFIPDSKNSAVILTSVDKSLAGSHRLLHPVPVKVLPLSEDEARELLFTELIIKNPSQADIERATELVRKVDRLPLAIHAIGYRMRATGEPLAKYHIRPYSADPRLREPFKEIVEDLYNLRHFEARNLINILSFFGQHIPYEMVYLGIKILPSLGIEVRAREHGSRPDLNTTLGILIRYALIDRNDPDDTVTRGSHSSLTETIDMLKIHSVVQSFICENLKAAKQLRVWLGYAVRVFCHSFQEAHALIQKEGAGLVRDYREYEVHGRRLLDHVMRNRSKSGEVEPIHTMLLDCLNTIQEEIKRRTPTSSQEAIHGHIGQLSVFDRTSSTSDTGPETPHRRPSTVSTWGLEPGKPHMDSPLDLRIDSAQPQIVGHALMPPYEQDDAGYTSELDEPGNSIVMSRGHSQISLPISSAEHQATGGEGKRTIRGKTQDPQAHRTVSAVKRRRTRDKLGSWRYLLPMTPTTSITKVHIERFKDQSPSRTAGIYSTAASEAEAALAAWQRRSPPAPRGRGRLKDHRASSRGRQSDTSTDRAHAQSSTGLPVGPSPGMPSTSVFPIIASASAPVAPSGLGIQSDSALPILASPSTAIARLGSGTLSDTGLPVIASPSASIDQAGSRAMLREGSGDSTQSRQSRLRYCSTPLANEPFEPLAAAPSTSPQGPSSLAARANYIKSGHSSPTPRYIDFVQSSNPDLRSFRTSQPTSADQAFAPFYPLKDDEQRSNPMSPDRRSASPDLGSSFDATRLSVLDSSGNPPRASSSLQNIPPSSQYTLASYKPGPVNILSGGAQRPLGYSSEPMSREGSGQSIIEPRSLTGTEPSRFPPQFSPYGNTPGLAALERLTSHASLNSLAGGQSVQSYPGNVSLKQATPRFTADQDLALMGGWATPPLQPSTSPPRPTAGPGIALDGGFVQFGDYEQIDAEVAKAQAERERQERLRSRSKMQQAFENGVFRPRVSETSHVLSSAPYPAFSQMPRTNSDLRQLVEEEARGRKRGLSFPVPPTEHGPTGVVVTADETPTPMSTSAILQRM